MNPFSKNYLRGARLAAAELEGTSIGNIAGKVTKKQSAEYRKQLVTDIDDCLLYTSPSPRDVEESRMPSSA